MNIRQMIVTAALSTGLTLALFAGALVTFGQARASPETRAGAQTSSERIEYLSISGLAFLPVQQNSTYRKDTQRQMVSLSGNNRSFTQDRNVFVAPVALPDRAELRAMTIFGEDYDSQGEVRLRLKRCDHRQARCIILAEAVSNVSTASGLFEITQAIFQRETVDNSRYSYYVDLDLTALNNSGLRAVRLELMVKDTVEPGAYAGKWSLAGNITSFPVPNTGLSQVEICTDDLSHLSNPTHFPFVVVDTRSIPLSSASCVTVWGRDIEIRRRLNTGPSSGTYDILR